MGEVVYAAFKPRPRTNPCPKPRRVICAIDELVRIEAPSDIEEIKDIWEREPDHWPVEGNP